MFVLQIFPTSEFACIKIFYKYICELELSYYYDIEKIPSIQQLLMLRSIFGSANINTRLHGSTVDSELRKSY